MGRPFGVPVVVGPSWFLVAVLITWVFQPQVARALPQLGELSWLVSLAYAVLLYVSVLVHELAHSVTALRMGLPVKRITLHLLGGVSEIERQPQTPLRALLVSVSGPVLNLVLAGLGWLVLQVAEPGTVVGELASALTWANLVVAVFNLLPGLPLDGGFVLEALVWRLRGDRLAGTVAAAWVGRALAVLLVAGPLVVASLTEGRLPLLTVVWGVFLGSFIWVGAGQALAGARTRARLPGLVARRLARRAVPVPRDLPVAEAVRRAQAAGAGALVVVDAADRPVAIVEEAAVAAMPEQRRPWVPVGDVARRLDPDLVLDADLEGEPLVEAINRRPAPEYLLKDRQGLVYGVLVLSDVERVLSPQAPQPRQAPR
ncbi:site-2 protease family protein [Vallicoccus soli]|uniref:Zinc metalloprotease n=1 Tax=Vallicoccus soli TaxID=2339232 RepID=A0A3A3YYU3_9ACTN|nr:site-2 protease family protein [Vallicoccus soli]